MMKYNAGYTSIKQVSEFENRKVTLVGVVVEFSFPRKSRGTDYVTILKIVDDSQQCPELFVNVFTKQIDDLPHVRSHGDLILLTNVMIRKHDKGMTAVFYKNFSAFALCDGNPSDDFRCYQATLGFNLEEAEKHLITRLRQWRGGFQLSPGTMDNLLSLKDISNGKHFDLICKVVDIYKVAENVWMLLLWDGTDAPPLSLHGKLKDEENNPLPLHVEPSLLDRKFHLKYPSFGTILRVTADVTYENFGQHFSSIDKWVRICYICCQVSSGMWHGSLSPSSSVRLLSNSDNIVLEYERKYNERIVRKHGRLPQWVDLSSHFLTGIDGEIVRFSTLIDVLRYAEVDPKFFCVVRVVAMHPFQAQDFCSFDVSSEYRTRLTLEDSTARIHALLAGEEWMRFFEACPVDQRNTKVKMLLGVPEQQNLDNDDEFTRNPPWIKCCIQWKNGLFYVCSTWLVPN
ncbi:hypothetical protein ACOSQ4_028138 [Xanthoceras sorbifolium]